MDDSAVCRNAADPLQEDSLLLVINYVKDKP